MDDADLMVCFWISVNNLFHPSSSYHSSFKGRALTFLRDYIRLFELNMAQIQSKLSASRIMFYAVVMLHPKSKLA